jgi:hypothetical protein
LSRRHGARLGRTSGARRAAKLSIADAALEAFTDLKDLITSVPAEADMTAHQPPITVASTSNRVAEERRNVRLRAFLYAASREDDNDFHLIVGRAPTLQPVYMTMEVSGLPPSNHRHRATLKQVRDDYKAFFQHHPLGLPGASYAFYVPPIPVEIEGSLFFDMSHVTGGRTFRLSGRCILSPGLSSNRKEERCRTWGARTLLAVVVDGGK